MALVAQFDFKNFKDNSGSLELVPSNSNYEFIQNGVNLTGCRLVLNNMPLTTRKPFTIILKVNITKLNILSSTWEIVGLLTTGYGIRSSVGAYVNGLCFQRNASGKRVISFLTGTGDAYAKADTNEFTLFNEDIYFIYSFNGVKTSLKINNKLLLESLNNVGNDFRNNTLCLGGLINAPIIDCEYQNGYADGIYKKLYIYDKCLDDNTINNIINPCFLLKEGNSYYSIASKYYNIETKKYNAIDISGEYTTFSLSDLTKEATINNETFKPLNKFINPTLISKENKPLITKGLKSNKQLVVASAPISVRMASNIDNISLTKLVSENSTIKLSVSIDEGKTWYTFKNNEWVNLGIKIPLKEYSNLTEGELTNWNNARDTIFNDGIDSTILNTVDFNLLKADLMQFAYVLYNPTYSDICKTTQMSMQFDAKGSFRKMKDSEYELDVLDSGIVITSNIDTDIMKVNVGYQNFDNHQGDSDILFDITDDEMNNTINNGWGD